jgi:parvulin-like peptidyl-prolyl isomerase
MQSAKKANRTGKKTIAGKLLLACAGGLMITVICAIAIYALSHRVREDDPVVATVTNEPITVQEFKRAMRWKRAETALYFQTKYGAQDESKLWTSSYGGESPLQVLKAKALDAAVSVKIQQLLAKQKGIIQDVSYAAFEKDLKLENERRAKALTNKQAIYGPVQFEADAYFDYQFANLVTKLKEKLQGNEIQASDQQLQAHYEATKDQLYRKDGEVVVEKIALPYVDADGTISAVKKEDAEQKITQAKARLDGGASFEKLAEAYNETDSDKKSYGKQVLGSSTVRGEQDGEKLLEEAGKLAIGQASGIFETNHTYYLIKCIDKTEAGYQAFDEVKESVRLDYGKKSYDALIDRKAKDAKLQIHEDVYDSVRL